jgi:hypothetical protein
MTFCAVYGVQIYGEDEGVPLYSVLISSFDLFLIKTDKQFVL